jgi:hypothetical protein
MKNKTTPSNRSVAAEVILGVTVALRFEEVEQ